MGESNRILKEGNGSCNDLLHSKDNNWWFELLELKNENQRSKEIEDR